MQFHLILAVVLFAPFRLMDDRNKILLLQKSGGTKVTSASVAVNIDSGITYNV
jgi:hypothetical protein